MVFAEHPLAESSRQGLVGDSSRDLRELWRVSNPTMPPQASPVVDRSCRVEKTQKFVAEPEQPNLPKVKCVLIGDGTIGKTSLIVSYTTNGYPTEYVPTAFDNYSVIVTVDDHPLRLQLCDTAGQDDFDSLRPLCYPNTDIFLLCFSVVSPTSFHNINDKWLSEIRQHCPKIPIILVGTQCDLRNDVKVLIELAHYNDKPVSEQEARQKATELGALDYIECSALTQKNLKEVFDTAILAALEKQGLLGKKLSKKSQKYKCSNVGSNRAIVRTENNFTKEIVASTASPVLPSKHYRSSKSKSGRGWKKLCCFS